MIHLSLRPRAASRHRDDRAGRLSVPALLGVALLVAATAPAVAASHGGGGGHSGGGHSGGGGHASAGGHAGGGHAGGGHGGGGMHTMPSGPVSGGFHGGGNPNGWHGGTVGHNGGRGFHDHDGFHGGFRGGFHDGRFFNSPRFFFPRFGFYGALGFTWGTPFFWGFPYDYWPYYYSPYYYGWDGPGPYYGYDRARRDEQGALDLDLSPADTQVFVDGQLVGKVDDFDGWPQYLWLDPGTYDIVFYREGYRTLARQVTIYRGLVIDWNDSLEKGPSTRPEELPSKTHERRDARIQQDREMQDRAERDGGYYRRRDDDRRDGDWRDRADRDRSDRADRDSNRGDDDRPAAREPRHLGRVRLDVTPGDASVYLDGRFVGTAEEVAQSGGLTVGAGDHSVSVVRPGRRSEERHFTAKVGEDTTLSIDLHNE